MARRDIHRSIAPSGGGVQLRLFSALSLPDDRARQLAELADRLSSRAPGSRGFEASELHVTFAFLGNVVEECIPLVAAALDTVAASVPGPTQCTLRNLGTFGGGRVLGADVDVDLHAMLDSARDSFVESIAPIVPDVDRRRWHPHLSLVRARAGSGVPDTVRSDDEAIDGMSWVSRELRLYASLPGPAGSLYKELHAVPFGLPVEHA